MDFNFPIQYPKNQILRHVPDADGSRVRRCHVRRIAVLGERGHDHIPFYPVPVFPRGRFPEPYLVVYPVRLQHIG